MSKFKAKLTALLMAMCCCFACIGIGVSMNKSNNVVANAATTEELTAEFTNNGQFALATSSKTTGGYTVIDGTAAQSTLPEGYSGSVLEIYHSGGSDGYDFVTVDFSNSKIPAKDVVSIVVRAWVDNFNSAGDEFRTIGAVVATQRQYGVGAYDLSTWCDVPLTSGSISDMTDADGYLNAIDLGLRDKTAASHLYIDSVTVNTYQDINLGKVALYGNSLSAPATSRLYLAKADGTNMGAELKDVDFTYESGTGFNVNGTQFGMKIRQRDKRFFCYYPEDNADIKTLLTDERKPDTITVGGTYINKEKGIRYIIEDTTFTWNGTVWEPKYTTYNVGDVKFKQIGAEGKHIYFSPVSTANFDTTTWNSGWDAVFSWKDGVGVTINGETVSNAKVKFPGSFFIEFATAPQVGDILCVGGTYYNASVAKEYKINEAELKYNGTAWETVIDEPEVQYTITEVGTLKVHGHSASTTTNKPSATALYMKSSITLPFTTWDDKFNLESGDGFKLNGNNVTTGQLVSADKNLYVSLANANVQVGDILSVSGTFVHATARAKYVIEESKFIWTGLVWENYIEPTTYNISKVAIDSDSSATAVNFKKANSEAFEVKDDTWSAKMRFITGTGVGVTLNGAQIENAVGTAKFKMNDIKLPNNMYVGLGATAVEGDELVIGGTFYFNNGTVAANYVIEESKFIYNGTAWEAKIDYDTYTVTKIASTKDSSATALHLALTSDKTLPAGDWDKVYTFEVGSGDGIKLGDTVLTTTDIKQPGGFYINLKVTAVAGDTVTIDGAYYNEALERKFVFENCHLTFDGAKWVENYVPPVEYTVYDLGALSFKDLNGGKVNFPQFNHANEVTIPTDEQWVAYTCIEGVGAKLNGTAVAAVKFPGLVFIELASAPVAGDKLTVGGTFVNKEKALKFVITETTFWWNGTAWQTEEYIEPTEATVHELGELAVHSNSSGASSNTPKATQLYMQIANGMAIPYPDAKWETEFALESGDGWKVNGVKVEVQDIESTDAGLFVALSSGLIKVGDVLTVSGTFFSEDVNAKYVISETAFMWNGSFWVNYVTDDRLEVYDVVTIQDIGLGEELTIEGTVDQSSHKFTASAGNTTNSVAVRFGYNCADTALAGSSLRFRLRGAEWQGILFDLKDGKIWLEDADKSYPLASNTDYVIELGAISMKDGRVWTYIKLDEVMVRSTVITTSEFEDFKDFATVGFKNHVSIYATKVAKTTINNPDVLKVTYVSSAGTHVEKVKKNETYALAVGKGLKTFIGWACDGVLYAPGTVITVDKAMTFTAVEIDFTMEKGAAIRLAQSADQSGIRFTSWIKEAELNELLGKYGITNISYGTLIMPYDYLALDEAPNLVDFDEKEEEILKIPSTMNEQQGDYVIFRGAMRKLYEENYNRLFAGRGYMEITFANGEVWTVYTPFDKEDNVRSVRYIARAMQTNANGGEDEYAGLDEKTKAVVDAYALADEIVLMNYNAYEANAMPIIAWNFPKLDPTNNYMNDANIAVANTMKEAGIKVIGLTGANILSMNTVANIEKTRQIINFFWSQGIGTFAFQNNGGNSFNNNFAAGYPDFSDCEGFMGFLAWDEPTLDSIDTIATQVAAFENAYAGTDVIFMGNLLPSYASIFGENGNPDKAAFKAYLQKYCDVVLSKVSGTKWLSLDTYPILENKTLVKNFLFDIGALKTTALANDAHAHVILQSYGYVENGNADKERMPSEAELRMQAYAAMAFGVDSMSWYVYSPNGHGECDTAVDVNGAVTDTDNYNAFKNINAELTAIGKVYNAFTWKGIILGAGKNNGLFTKDNDYKAFEMVMGQLGEYELSASDTKYLASVKTNKTDWNYLMGVMEDMYGNEGYVLCNYNSHEKDRAQTITLTFDDNVTEVVIYRGGVAETVAVNNKTLTVDLATGEGVIILPSKIEK